MSHGKIDPKAPGHCTTNHADPHGRVASSGGRGGPRDSGGGFKAMARGGDSAHGDAIVSKHRPRGSAPGPSSDVPVTSDGDDWK